MIYNICYATDDNYIVQAAVSITSLLENNRDHKINLYILDNNISDCNQNILKNHVEKYGQTVSFCNVDEKLKTLTAANVNSYGGYGSYAAYARIFIGELLPPMLERVLYIDCDTVVHGDIKELYECDLHGKTLGAVRDITSSRYHATIGLEADAAYFNTGVLLIDLKNWRQRDYLQKIITHIVTVRAQYQTVDQDIINLVVSGDIHTLHPRYNHIIPINVLGWQHLCFLLDKSAETYYPKKLSKEARFCPLIIHYTFFFTGRPWFSNSMNGKYDSIWNEYLLLTPWSSYQKKCQQFSFAEKCQRLVLGHKFLPSALRTCIYKALISIHLKIQERNEKLYAKK